MFERGDKVVLIESERGDNEVLIAEAGDKPISTRLRCER